MASFIEDYQKNVEYTVSVLCDAGYNSYDQLYAYAITGNEAFITRKGEARNMITNLDRENLI